MQNLIPIIIVAGSPATVFRKEYVAPNHGPGKAVPHTTAIRTHPAIKTLILIFKKKNENLRIFSSFGILILSDSRILNSNLIFIKLKFFVSANLL